VNSSLTLRPKARGCAQRRWCASEGWRPHTRHACLDTNVRWSLSRNRSVLPEGWTLHAPVFSWERTGPATASDPLGGPPSAPVLPCMACGSPSRGPPSPKAASLRRKPVSTNSASAAASVFLAGRLRCAQSAAWSAVWRPPSSATNRSLNAADLSEARRGFARGVDLDLRRLAGGGPAFAAGVKPPKLNRAGQDHRWPTHAHSAFSLSALWNDRDHFGRGPRSGPSKAWAKTRPPRSRGFGRSHDGRPRLRGSRGVCLRADFRPRNVDSDAQVQHFQTFYDLDRAAVGQAFRKIFGIVGERHFALYQRHSFLPVVARALHLKPSRSAIRGCRLLTERATMFTRMSGEGRLLGFDLGDWTMLLGGLTLAALLLLLV
jgi:hypothetical protein